MAKPYITGYCNSLSVRPGEMLQFMVSAEGVKQRAGAIGARVAR